MGCKDPHQCGLGCSQAQKLITLPQLATINVKAHGTKMQKFGQVLAGFGLRHTAQDRADTQ